MLLNKKTKCQVLMEKEERQRILQEIEVAKYLKAVSEEDEFSCIKQLGILEYLEVKDIEFYTAISYQLAERNKDALKYFSKVPKTSQYYGKALLGMATIFSDTGNIKALNGILMKDGFLLTQADKFCMISKCIMNMSLDRYNQELKDIEDIEPPVVTSEDIKATNADEFWILCLTICESLVGAIHCIKQCKLHNELFEKDNMAVDEDIDLQTHTLLYSKRCHILMWANNIESIRFIDADQSFETCALNNIPWKRKFEVVDSIDYLKAVLRIMVKLLSPQLHSNIAEHEVIGHLLILCKDIHKDSVFEIITENYEVVKEGFLRGNSNIVEAVSYAYARLLVTTADYNGLKGLLDEFVELDEKVEKKIDEVMQELKMSEKVRIAWLTTEMAFNQVDKNKTGNTDFSSLSLQYFRILEMIINEKLMIPLADSVDLQKFKESAGKDDKERDHKWYREMNCIGKIKLDEKTRSREKASMQIGSARTIIENVSQNKDRAKDSCTQYLKEKMLVLLTDKGKEALDSGEIVKLLDNDAVVERYRTPGAHTGALPFSYACESREYTMHYLPIIYTWFKQ